eukprot:gb/GEZN01017202.1/.p1 GENE.gb/GEZN01017202.1/~~gb/GEZN01017202.1/.p1  ORF type:complete len:231 (-),score=10.18 gb/GEZN01017202.1/:82-774(-)
MSDNIFLEGEVRVFVPEKRELKPIPGSSTNFVLVERQRGDDSDEEVGADSSVDGGQATTTTRSGRGLIDRSRDRYPFCLVWGPLPGLTCCIPCVGHMGICDSKGRVHDFAGPYYVSVDSFMTSVAVFAPIDQARIITQDGQSVEESWDRAIEAADREYQGKMHNLCCQNCHHHTAQALNNAGIKSTLLRSYLHILRYGKYKSWCAFASVWVPFLMMIGFIVLISFWGRAN